MKYESGTVAMAANDFVNAAAGFRQAVELDPDFYLAHRDFIYASKRAAMLAEETEEEKRIPATIKTASGGLIGKKTRAIPMGGGPATKELLALYAELDKQYPGKAAIQWAIAETIIGSDKAKSAELLQKALQLDPNFAPAYKTLAVLAYKEPETRRGYLRKAAEVDPNDPETALDLAQEQQSDRTAYRAALEDVIARFPKDRITYSALLSLVRQADNGREKMQYLERVWKAFPDEKTIGFNWTMKDLFALFAEYEPEKTLPLAKAMGEAFDDDEWKTMAAFQRTILNAKSLVAEKKYAVAAKLLSKLSVPFGLNATSYYLLRAEAESAGAPAQGYKHLAEVAAKSPNDALNSALESYGAKMGKTPEEVQQDVWAIRMAKSVPFKEFELSDYEGKKVSLADHRGKVVLVNFWYPGCGPCLAEFPYIQQALQKFSSRGFTILAINTKPDEDNKVKDIMKKYDFIPLKSPHGKWAQETYKVTGTPANFLLDGQGRVIFRPFIHDSQSLRVFEREIEELLGRDKPKTMQSIPMQMSAPAVAK
ncbi:MAG TPA: redoxin domain-containing protein [Clostridia bacterium]|nr:redoxin domain-containing protein [Clostridia bacterium]